MNTAEVRYGAALVGILFGGYVIVTADYFSLVFTILFPPGYDPVADITTVVRLIAGTAIIVTSFAIVPASRGRRIGAMSVAVVVVAVYLLYSPLRLSGATAVLGPINILTSPYQWPGFVVALAGLLGWLIVRARPAPSYLALLPVLVVGYLPIQVYSHTTGAEFLDLAQAPLAALVGVGGAWIAVAIERAVSRRGGDKALQPSG